MNYSKFLVSIGMLGMCVGGVACEHHHHHSHPEPVYEPAPPPLPPPGPVIHQEVFYDERGAVIEDPVVVERVRYYHAEPQEIVVHNNSYYFRGQPVTDPREIHCMDLARYQDRYRPVHRP